MNTTQGVQAVIDLTTHPHFSEAAERQYAERRQAVTAFADANAAERRAQTRVWPDKDSNAKADTAIDIPPMLATKRTETDAAWNRDRVG